jgi:2-dehydro-3-deoxygluconokinase
VDYYLPSIEEAGETFASRDPRVIAERAFAAGVRKVVVLKRGSKGCYALPRGGTPIELPAFKVRVMDATGAGDCFDGGLLAGILKGFPLRESLRLGNAAGALNVSGPGGYGKLESFRQARRLAGI